MPSSMAQMSADARKARSAARACRLAGVEQLPVNCLMNQVRIVTSSYCTRVTALPISDVFTPPSFSTERGDVCRLVTYSCLIWQGHVAVKASEEEAINESRWHPSVPCTCGGSDEQWKQCEYFGRSDRGRMAMTVVLLLI